MKNSIDLNIDLEAKDNDGYTALNYACYNNHPKIVDMIKRYPQLLEPTFQKGEPVHGVWHKIETADHPPCKTKRRPILANAEKNKMGKEVWEKMLKDGELPLMTMK